MKKYLIVIILTIIAGFGFFFFKENNRNTKIAINEVIPLIHSPTPIPTPSPGLPKTLIVPTLNITVPVEHVGKDEEGLMDVPSVDTNTAWYNLGPRPGEEGNSVIAGHVDTPTGDPSVFYSINTLKNGDELIVVDEENNRQRFKVTGIKTFKATGFPVQEVFGEFDGKRLNLITCGGTWDNVNKDYSDRIVVFSEKVN